MSMQKDGWELNVEIERDHYRHGYSVRLAGRHSGLSLMMYSGIAVLDIQELWSKNQFRYWSESMEFPISAQNIAQNIMMPAIPSRSVSRFSVDFENPFLAEVSTSQIMSLEDIFFFQPTNPKSTIYLPDNEIMSVQGHLDDILSKQKKKQAEIREKKRRQKYKQVGSTDAPEFTGNPAKEEIKLQLVAI